LTKIELGNSETKYATKLYELLAKELSDNTIDYLDGSMTVEEAEKIFEKCD
jgi:hypothetical protein